MATAIGPRTSPVRIPSAACGSSSIPNKLGKGGAIQQGLLQVKYDYVGYLDADGPISPVDLGRLIDVLGEFDCAVASRWVRGSHAIRQEPLANRFAAGPGTCSHAPSSSSRCATPSSGRSSSADPSSSGLKAVALTNRSFDVDLLYHIRKHGFRVSEVPVTWTHDPDTRMPIARAVPLMFLSLVGVRVMNLPISRWVSPADG